MGLRGVAALATTLSIYVSARREEAQHAADIRTRMSRSELARLLGTRGEPRPITLPVAARTTAERANTQPDCHGVPVGLA